MKKIKKTILVLAIVLGLSAVTAYADPRGDTGKRDVILEAATICNNLYVVTLPVRPSPGADPKEIQAFACLVLAKTDGTLDIDSFKCVDNPPTNGGNGFVEYRYRNCEKNEDALLRGMSSVILSLEDVIARGKMFQKETAAEYACSYATKASALIAVEKLQYASTYPDTNLVADARAIATALGFSCP